MKNTRCLKRILSGVLLIVGILFCQITVFAMEPVTNGFTISNKGEKTITVNISNEEGYSEDVSIPGKDFVYKSYSFNEPGTYEYTIKRTDSKDDPAYIMAFWVETNADGKMECYAIPRISGEKVKPQEISFGKPEVVPKTESLPKTGDNSNIYMYIAIVACAALIIVVLLWVITRKNGKKKQDDELNELRNDSGSEE